MTINRTWVVSVNMPINNKILSVLIDKQFSSWMEKNLKLVFWTSLSKILNLSCLRHNHWYAHMRSTRVALYSQWHSFFFGIRNLRTALYILFLSYLSFTGGISIPYCPLEYFPFQSCFSDTRGDCNFLIFPFSTVWKRVFVSHNIVMKDV